MSVELQSSGDLEILCAERRAEPGATLTLVFRALDDSSPPYALKIRGPGGKVLLERVLRELPTGRPQSAPAVSFPAAVAGVYAIELKELYGKLRGEATLTLTVG